MALSATFGLALLGSWPARAVFNGAPDAGPLARGSLMVVSPSGMCSAVVVAPDVVLTAGHCATATVPRRVHYKEADGAAGGRPVLIEPAASAVHPGYVAGAVAKRARSIDLALIRLPAPLPGRFSAVSLSGASPSAGASVTLGGYGTAEPGNDRSTGTFRVARLAVIEPHGKSRILVWTSGKKLASAKGPTQSGACEGDSGGPMALGDEGPVFAVTGWAAGKGGCGELSQGVLLGPQRAWIDKTLAGWGRQANWVD